MSRFETEILTSDENVQALTESLREMGGGSQSAIQDKGIDPGHGWLGESDPRTAGGFGFKRLFRVHVLSSAVLLQPIRQLGGDDVAGRQRA